MKHLVTSAMLETMAATIAKQTGFAEETYEVHIGESVEVESDIDERRYHIIEATHRVPSAAYIAHQCNTARRRAERRRKANKQACKSRRGNRG